jgi:hypothetical protein
MDLEKLWKLVIESLWAPETYLKLLFVALTAPFWWPLARAMALEILPVMRDDDSVGRPLPPGLDPFLSIPLARYRAAQRARTGAAGHGAGRTAPRRGF